MVKCVTVKDPNDEVTWQGCGTSFFVEYPSRVTLAEAMERLKELHPDHRRHKPFETVELVAGDFPSDNSAAIIDLSQHPVRRGRPPTVRD